jgi:hypothetical protein
MVLQGRQATGGPTSGDLRFNPIWDSLIDMPRFQEKHAKILIVQRQAERLQWLL